MSQSLTEYHEFVQAQENRTLFQTPEWGEVKASGEWKRDVLFVMNDSHQPVAAAMILYRPLPVVKQYLAYAPRGIVTDYHNEQQFSEVIDTLKKYLKQKSVFSLKIDPEIPWRERNNDFSMVEDGFNNEKIRQMLGRVGFISKPLDLGFSGIQPQMTMVVHLKDEGKGIIQQFNSKERYKVNFAQKKGVVCYRGSIEDMDDYEYLNKITAERDQYIARSQEYLTTIYQTLHPYDMMDIYFAKLDYRLAKKFAQERIVQATADIERMDSQIASTQNQKKIDNLSKQKATAQQNIEKYHRELEELDSLIDQYPEGKLLSGAIVATYGDTAYYLYGANITEEAGLNANKALQTWIMQKLYDEKGIRKYDMYGVASNTEDHTGITQFKQSFDPELVEYIGEFDLPINRFWSTVFVDVAPKIMALKKQWLIRKSRA